MKPSTGLFGDKLSSVEVGTIKSVNETNTSSSILTKNRSTEKLSKILKIILYLELIFFIGWFGCLFASYPIAGPNNRSADSETTIAADEIRANNFAYADVEDRTENEINRTINRDKRSPWDDKREDCESTENETRTIMDELTNALVIGDESDRFVRWLRAKCRGEIEDLMLRVETMKMITTRRWEVPDNEHWNELAENLKEIIMNSTTYDYRRSVNTTNLMTTNITNDLRDLVESMIRNYNHCGGFVATGIYYPRTITGLLMNRYDMCERILNELKENIRPLVNSIIPGNSTDMVVEYLRNNVVSVAMQLAVPIKRDKRSNLTEIIDRIENSTDEDVKNYFAERKRHLATLVDSQQRERLEEIEPPTPEIVEVIRFWAMKYLEDLNGCRSFAKYIDVSRYFPWKS